MRIVTLIENTGCREDLVREHGLSLYIETGAVKILFDAGQSGAFADNAQKLGVDLSRVDFMVLSHGHYDHGGGIRRFLEINKTAPVYLSRDAFAPCHNGSRSYIGLDGSLAENPRLVFVDGDLELFPGIMIRSGRDMEYRHPLNCYGLQLKLENGWMPDSFRHEQYLLIREGEAQICFSGCSHRGIQNIVGHFGPDVLVGGFHFMKLEDRGELISAARELLGGCRMYYTGHCTGERQYEVLKSLMGPRLEQLTTGGEFVISPSGCGSDRWR